MLLGHVALPFIMRHYLKTDLAPLATGTIFPDFFDKSLQQLGLARSGRSIAHTLLAVSATTFLLRTRFGRRAARDWLLGYLGHLVCDLGGLVPWWYPFTAYNFEPSTRNMWQKIKDGLRNFSLFELLLLVWALRIVRSDATKEQLGMRE